MIDTEILKGKNAFISGATGAIGGAVAKKLANHGCNLFLTGTSQGKLQKLSNDLSKFNINVAYKEGDLRHKDQIYKIITASNSYAETFDILINVAGIFPQLNLHDSNDEIYEDSMNINFRSAFIFSREFSKQMVSQKWGRIVNIGSVSSYFGYRSTSLYCASKHALLGFSRAIHEELKQYNVRTFSILPSSTQSEIGLQTKNQDYSTFLNPIEIANYVVFVVSHDNNLVSKEILLERMVIK